MTTPRRRDTPVSASRASASRLVFRREAPPILTRASSSGADRRISSPVIDGGLRCRMAAHGSSSGQRCRLRCVVQPCGHPWRRPALRHRHNLIPNPQKEWPHTESAESTEVSRAVPQGLCHSAETLRAVETTPLTPLTPCEPESFPGSGITACDRVDDVPGQASASAATILPLRKTRIPSPRRKQQSTKGLMHLPSASGPRSAVAVASIQCSRFPSASPKTGCAGAMRRDGRSRTGRVAYEARDPW
jgi:hypothetical protein